MKIDGLVKSPTSALRFILRHCSVLKVRLIPQDLRTFLSRRFYAGEFGSFYEAVRI
jgi:hypothetical protein